MLKSKRECMKNIILPPFVSGSPVCDMFLPVGTSSPPKPIYFFYPSPIMLSTFYHFYHCSPPLPFSCPILSYLPFFLCQSHVNISQLHISHPFTQTHAGTTRSAHSLRLSCKSVLFGNDCVPNRVKV